MPKVWPIVLASVKKIVEALLQTISLIEQTLMAIVVTTNLVKLQTLERSTKPQVPNQL